MRSTEHPRTGTDINDPPPATRADQRHVLVVEDDSAVRHAITEAIRSPRRRVHHAADLAAARKLLADQPIDLALIDVGLPDGDGLTLARALRDADRPIRSIVITGRASLEHAVDAIRSGADDFIAKPFDVDQLNRRVTEAIRANRHERRRRHQFDRLRKLCKQLNRARHEITDQVDILCNDLVAAYEELAEQVSRAEQARDDKPADPPTDPAWQIDDELDLEPLLRRTMEHLLDRAGAANVMIFLPSSGGGYTVGGYVNYSYDKHTLPVVMQQLAEDAAERLMSRGELVRLDTDAQIGRWIEIGRGFLEGMNIVAIPCVDEAGEPLAGIMLFRPVAEPLGDTAAELLRDVAPVLAAQLVRVIRVHHRTKDLLEDDNDTLAA